MTINKDPNSAGHAITGFPSMIARPSRCSTIAAHWWNSSRSLYSSALMWMGCLTGGCCMCNTSGFLGVHPAVALTFRAYFGALLRRSPRVPAFFTMICGYKHYFHLHLSQIRYKKARNPHYRFQAVKKVIFILSKMTVENCTTE